MDNFIVGFIAGFIVAAAIFFYIWWRILRGIASGH